MDQIQYDCDNQEDLEKLEICFPTWEDVDRVRTIINSHDDNDNLTMQWNNCIIKMKVKDWKKLVSFDIDKKIGQHG